MLLRDPKPITGEDLSQLVKQRANVGICNYIANIAGWFRCMFEVQQTRVCFVVVTFPKCFEEKDRKRFDQDMALWWN